jgi:hypothetical protein
MTLYRTGFLAVPLKPDQAINLFETLTLLLDTRESVPVIKTRF